ncbi:MAG TPA: hypothetical protein VNA31_09135 [bacterium]|nr:hypothetical protein [bacterium]
MSRRAIQRFLDEHQTFGERFLAYLVGGIEEVRVPLESGEAPEHAA